MELCVALGNGQEHVVIGIDEAEEAWTTSFVEAVTFATRLVRGYAHEGGGRTFVRASDVTAVRLVVGGAGGV